jgi:hypothetical protein
MPLISPKTGRAFVSANCAPRTNWQFFIQQQSNGTWRCVDKYSQFITINNLQELIFFMLADHINEPSRGLDRVIWQFAGRHIGAPPELSSLHIYQ